MSNDNERTQHFPPEPSYTGQHYYPSAPQYFGHQPQQKPPGAKNGQALTSMVLGIVALCFAWPFTWPVGLICGILAVIFGTKGKQHSQGKAGRIMGWIAAPLSIVWLIVWIVAISSVNHAIKQYNSHYNSATPSISAKVQANSPDQCLDPNTGFFTTDCPSPPPDNSEPDTNSPNARLMQPTNDLDPNTGFFAYTDARVDNCTSYGGAPSGQVTFTNTGNDAASYVAHLDFNDGTWVEMWVTHLQPGATWTGNFTDTNSSGNLVGDCITQMSIATLYRID